MAASGSYVYSYAWTRTGGGASEEFGGQDVAIDQNGNVFITGGFGGTVEFNGVDGGDEHTANGDYNDVFITKYNANGSYGWTKTFGASFEDYGMGIATDSQGSVFVTGYFFGEVDFDVSDEAEDIRTATGQDAFITKYNSDGTYGWTKILSATGTQIGYALTTDSEDNVIAMGIFTNSVNFNDSGGEDIHSDSDGNVYITKYSSEGSYVWTMTFASSGADTYYEVATDQNNYIYATGYFTGTAKFNGGENFTSNGSDDIYIVKLGTSGTYEWTKTIGGTGSDRGSGITADANGFLYVTGYFSNTVNFDLNEGSDEHIADGGKDMFIAKLKNNGESVWTMSIGGNTIYDWGNGVAVDEIGNIFFTGAFGDTVNFDATGGTDNHTSGPGGDSFISKYNADGSYGWTRTFMGETLDDCIEGLAVSANEKNVYVTGFYIGTIDFASGEEDYHSSDPGNFDFFLTSYTDDTPDILEVNANASEDVSIVEWTTDIESSTQVEYGLIQYFGKSTDETDTVTRLHTHSKEIANLKVCARYHYRVLSTDENDNKGISEKRYFNTSGCLASSITSGVSDYIAVTGGTLSAENGQTTVTLLAPSNYYSEGSINQINILDPNGVPSTPSGTSLVKGNFYNLLAVSDSDEVISSFDEPIVFTINYGSDTQASFYENTLDVYKYNVTGWDKQNCTLDTLNNTITCYLGSFSVYAVLGTATEGFQSMTYLSAASAPFCSDLQNQSIPDLFQIDVGSTQATAYYAPVIGQNTDYYISFSERLGVYEHGTFTGQGISKGVLSHSVYHLKSGTTYYFMVRGQNGCMPGNWSEEMKIRTGSKGSNTIPYYKYY